MKKENGTREGLIPPPVRGKNSQKRIIVIGGGVTGVLSAFELARSGHKVTLVEMGALGNGSSQRSAACIRQQFDNPSTVRGMIYSTRFFKNWNVITSMVENPLTQNGYLFLYDWTADKRALQRKVKLQQKAGLEEVRFLTREKVEEKFPYLQLVGITCATWCPTDGFLQPHIIYNDGAEATKKLGAIIHPNTKVIGATVEGNLIKVVKTNKGNFETDMVINASGAWGGRVSELLGGAKLPIIAKRRYLYFVDGPKYGEEEYMTAEQFEKCPMIIGPNGSYSRPTPEEKFMMGWLQYTAGIDDPDKDDQDAVEKGYGTGDVYGYGSAMMHEMARWLPETGKKPLHVTCGFYEETPDHNPIIDYDPMIENLIHAVGFSGHGLMHSPFSARVVTELVCNGPVLGIIDLPFGLNCVDILPFSALRDFSKHEGTQI